MDRRHIMTRLREDRVPRMSLEELGKLVDLSPSALSQWERGDVKHPRREHVKRVDDALGADGQVLAFYGFTQRDDADIVALVDGLTMQVAGLRSLLSTQGQRLDSLAGRIAALEQ